MTDYLSTEGSRSPSDNHLMNIRRSGSDFVKNVTIIETAPSEDLAARALTKMTTTEAPAQNILRAIGSMSSILSSSQTKTKPARYLLSNLRIRRISPLTSKRPLVP
ncbi:hypothetical protein ACTXT7_010285 [Hymenolepis weldensis]